MFRTKSGEDNWGYPSPTLHKRYPSHYYENIIRKSCSKPLENKRYQQSLQFNLSLTSLTSISSISSLTSSNMISSSSSSISSSSSPISSSSSNIISSSSLSSSSPASDHLSHMTVIYSKDTLSYNHYQSIDWIPENKNLYLKGSLWGKKNQFQFLKKKRKFIQSIECHLDLDDNQTHWEITRIGPFITTGGYDWIQIGWDDVWALSSILKSYPNGIFLIGQYVSPVLADGTRLSNPPIHIDHLYSGHDPYIPQRGNPAGCLLKDVGCIDSTRILEFHSDSLCSESEGDCGFEFFADGYGKHITKTLGIEGELNDLRPPNSPPLEWYLEVGVNWSPNIPNETLRPLSLTNYGGPATFDTNLQQSYHLTFEVPTFSDSIFWYTGRMNHGGNLVRGKVHAHSTLFQEAFFFFASPNDLGLVENHGFTRESSHQAILPGEVGFQNTIELRKYLFDELDRTQFLFRNRSRMETKEKIQIPRLICHSIGQTEILENFAYDRRPLTSCDDWTWKKGDIFTVVGFNKWQGYPIGPHQPFLDDIPNTLPGHLEYWLSYDSLEMPLRSNWRYALQNRYPDGGLDDVSKMEGYQQIAMRINGYTSPHWHDWTLTPHSILGFILFTALRNLILTFIILLGLLGYCIYFSYHLWKKIYRDALNHKNSDDSISFFHELTVDIPNPLQRLGGTIIPEVEMEEQRSLLSEPEDEDNSRR